MGNSMEIFHKAESMYFSIAPAQSLLLLRYQSAIDQFVNEQPISITLHSWKIMER